MTLGERITEIRKENHLSQEAFGDKLAVSRQAISKWEADQSIPDVEKLILLCQTFEVNIGWLLGMEEKKTQEVSELNDVQKEMVQEIVHQYIDALKEMQNGPQDNGETKQEQKHNRKTYLSAGIIAAISVVLVVLLVWGTRMNQTLQELQNRNNQLQQNYSDLEYSLNNQISGITAQVQDTIEQGASILADSAVSDMKPDYKNNEITCTVYCVPKVMEEGLTVRFTLDNGENVEVQDGIDDGTHKFAATLTNQLTDSIIVKATLIHGGKEETQQITTYENLLLDSYPYDYDSFEYEFSKSLSELKRDGYKEDIEVSFGSATNAYMKEEIYVESVDYVIQINGKRKDKVHCDMQHQEYEDSRGTASFDMEFVKELKESDELKILTYVNDSVGRTYQYEETEYRMNEDYLELLSTSSLIQPN